MAASARHEPHAKGAAMGFGAGADEEVRANTKTDDTPRKTLSSATPLRAPPYAYTS